MDSATTAPTKLSFSFKSKTTAKPPPPKAAQPAAFGFGDEEADAETPSASSSKPGKPGKFGSGSLRPPVQTQTAVTKAMQREMEAQKKVDATVYQYDEVYDRLKEAERQAEKVKEQEAKIRQPKYIGNLLQAAELRKRDHLIAEEKMIQKEREMEGDEFADKEKFVTQAYKDQLAANRKAEEAEKLREEMEKKQKGKAGPGMTHFYASLLQQSEEKHAAIISAASKPVIGPALPETSAGPNLTIKPPTEPKESSDLEKVQRARAEGKVIELNDDNQIVDKRELLSAGLNLSAKNTRDLAAYRKSKENESKDQNQNMDVHTAVGAAASRQEIEARRRRQLEDQMVEEKERQERERIRQEEESRARAIKRKNDEEAVMSARERYLERKRRKLEQPEAMDDE